MASTNIYVTSNIKEPNLKLLKFAMLYENCPVSATSNMPNNIGTLGAGEEVKIISMCFSYRTNTYWYMVLYASGSKTGWINNGLTNNILNVQFVERGTVQNDTNQYTVNDLYQFKHIVPKEYYIAKEKTRVAITYPTKPGVGTEAVDNISSGTKFIITDMKFSPATNTYWYRIKYGPSYDSSGWINNGNNNNTVMEVKFDITSTTVFREQDLSSSNKSVMDREKDDSTTTTSNKVTTAINNAKDLSSILDTVYTDNKTELENLVLANGIEYSAEHNYLWYTRFDRFGVVNPYNALMGPSKEYLFFVKPDLNIIDTSKGKKNPALMPNISSRTYFQELLINNKEVINALQYSVNSTPFIPVLTNAVKNNLSISSVEADVIEGPANIYGTSIEYRGSSEKSDENVTFSLEFIEDENRSIYNLFKAYDEYERLKSKGKLKLSEKDTRHIRYAERKILHDRFGIYKFIIGEDGETILYYAYICGAMPMNVPRDAYSEIEPGKRMSYSIDWKAPFINEDPIVLFEFQRLCDTMVIDDANLERAKWFTTNKNRMSGKRARKPSIGIFLNEEGRKVYKLLWYYDKKADSKKQQGGLFDI